MADELEIVRPKDERMCPIGLHIVQGHKRTCGSGRKTWVDIHPARNHTHDIIVLLEENLQYIFWNSAHEFPLLPSVFGFSAHNELDPLIQFWVDYWIRQGLPFLNGFDPLIIKVIIAIESSFIPTAKSKIKGSSACGLMQLTNQALRILSGSKNAGGYRELKSNSLRLERSDLAVPNLSIAAGTRWLFHKYSSIKLNEQKTLYYTIKKYHSDDKEGDAYAKKVLSLYEKSKKPI